MMAGTRTGTQANLVDALADFEASLLTPIVSGDLSAWVVEVERVWAKASPQIHFDVSKLHPRQFDGIARQDPELLPQIDLLRAEDQVIERQCDQFAEALNCLAREVAGIGPDEEKAKKRTSALIDEGVSLLGRVRKQRIAVQTWYGEAFHRDRGAVD